MKLETLLGALALCASLASFPCLAAGRAPVPAPSENCADQGDLHFICNMRSVEDLLPVDNGRYLVGGSLKRGAYMNGGTAEQGWAGLYLIDTAAKTFKVVSLSAAKKQSAGDPTCKPTDLTALATHGLDVTSPNSRFATVYAVNHRIGIDSVEIFRLNVAKASAVWTGCVLMPEGASANAVAALPDGSFVVTKLFDRRVPRGSTPADAVKVTGVVYHWVSGKGLREVPGTAFAGDNGILASRDGKTLYINASGAMEVWRVPLSGPGRPISAKLAFHPDNLRWAPDGQIFAAGQYVDQDNPDKPQDFGLAKLDPKTMVAIQVLKEPGTREFDGATTGVQVGGTLFFGASPGDRVAWRPAP